SLVWFCRDARTRRSWGSFTETPRRARRTDPDRLSCLGKEFSDQARALVSQAFLTQAVHHPLALTSLPPKMLQGPSASPGFPEYKLQLPHTALLSLRLLALVASIL